MTTKHAVFTTIAACHLLLVVCGASRFFPVCLGEQARKAVEVYGEYSGSSNGYGFFAPSVASRCDAKFSCYGASGPGWTDDAELAGNREVQLRVSTILSMFSDDNLREGLAASWAARMFGRYPDAALINVHLRVYALPTMAEYRLGERPVWVTFAVYPFAHNIERLADEE